MFCYIAACFVVIKRIVTCTMHFMSSPAKIVCVLLKSFSFLKCEPLPGVLGNKGTGAFIFREQGICSVYFQGTRELLIRLLGTREHQSIFNNMFF